MFPRHGAEVPVADARHPWRGVSRLLRKELFKIVHRHRLQDPRKVNVVSLMQDFSQLRRDHRMTGKGIVRWKPGFRGFRAPTQGFRKQILHVP